MELPYLGEILSALAPLAWAVAVILFRMAGRTVEPLALNLFKNTVGLLLLGITLLIVEAVAPGPPAWRETDPLTLGVLLLSGIVGISVADTFIFWGLNILGAARSSILGTAYPATVVLLSFVFLGERYAPWQWAGAAAVMVAIVLAALPEKRIGASEPLGGPLWLGVLVALIGVLGLGGSIVMAKPVLDDTPVVWASVLRLVGGHAALSAFCGLHPRRGALFAAHRPSPAWKRMVPAAVVGTYLSYMLWLGGMKYADVSTAAVLNQLHVVYVAILAALVLKERLGPARIAAVALGVVGSVVVALGGAGG